MDVVEHAIVAVVAIWVVKRIYDLGFEGVKNLILKTVISGLKVIPGVKGEIEKEQQKMLDTIGDMVRNKELDAIGEHYRALPNKGVSTDHLLDLMKEMRGVAKTYHTGKGFGGIYADNPEHEKFLVDAYALFADSNALYPDLFPALRKFEAEVVAMTCSMLRGDNKTCGTMTSGGTESILMVVKAYRESTKEKNPRIQPQMLVPVSAHAAFAKAAHYFGVEIVPIPVDDEYKVDIRAIRKAINPNVIMLIGSAPGYPHGVMDDIEELAKIAQEHGIGLHVDGCLGGFLLPFLGKLGHLKQKWDYSVPGVTSISCDLHKYGYSAKGASVITYRTKELRKHQFFAYTEWTGGVYCSPSMAGSRPGGLIASAWATMVGLGEEGYLKAADKIHTEFVKLLKGIEAIPGMYILGEPVACVIGLGWKGRPDSGDKDPKTIYKIVDAMKLRGWANIACLQKPICVHIPVALRETFDSDLFLADLAASAEEVITQPEKFAKGGMAAVYGTAASVPDRGLVSDLLLAYTDALLTV